MKTRYHLNALLLVALLGTATAVDAQVQPDLAKRYFEEATKLCERDAGRLWGVSLCGPMVIVDRATGTHATSQPEPEGQMYRFFQLQLPLTEKPELCNNPVGGDRFPGHPDKGQIPAWEGRQHAGRPPQLQPLRDPFCRIRQKILPPDSPRQKG